MNFRSLTTSLFWRSQFANVASRTFQGLRDLYKAFGYKRVLLPPDYRSRFKRNAVANRVVKALPKGTWRGGAEIVEDDDPNVETPFEAAWFDLNQRLKIWTVFQRADILAGIGRYAVVLIGAPGKMEEPLTSCSAEEIAYLTPFAEEDARIQTFEIDPYSERYGLPVMYQLNRVNMLSPEATNSTTMARRVHWTRIVHIADGLLDDNIYGEPRLECVWNLLDDLEKVSGGGAEAFFRRADGGTQWDLDPTIALSDDTDPDDPESDASSAAVRQIKKDIENIEHGWKKNIFTRGVTMNRMGSDVADFSMPVNSIISQISAGTGIPQRVLMGSEQGKLAAKMDRSNWDDRVADRRIDFATPYIVRPFVDRLIGLGALPPPETSGDYDVRWPQLKVLDDEQRAEIAGEWANLNTLAGQTVVTADEIREYVLDLPPLTAEQAAIAPPPSAANPQGVATGAEGTPKPAGKGSTSKAAAKRKGGASSTHVHRVADSFRPGLHTRRERLVWRRAQQAESKPPAASGDSGKREGHLSRAERSGSLY